MNKQNTVLVYAKTGAPVKTSGATVSFPKLSALHKIADESDSIVAKLFPTASSLLDHVQRLNKLNLETFFECLIDQLKDDCTSDEDYDLLSDIDTELYYKAISFGGEILE